MRRTEAPSFVLLATAVVLNLAAALYGAQSAGLPAGLILFSLAGNLFLFFLLYRRSRIDAPAGVGATRAEAPEPVPASIRDDAPFRRLVDEFPGAILILQDERPFYVNRFLLNLLELGPAEVGEEDFAFARLVSYVRHAARRSATVARSGTFRTVTARGRALVLEASVFPLGPAGSPLVVAVFLDQTTRETRDEQAREMETEILRHARLGAVGRVALGMTHGIADSLTAVLGTAEIGQIRHPELREFEDIVESARSMVRVVEDFSDKGRNDARTGPSIIDLNVLVRAELDLLTAYLPAAALAEVDLDLAADPPSFAGVYSDFSLSIGSLLANAVEAMDGGPRRFLRVRTRVLADAVTLEISHTGRGMERRELAGALRPAQATAGAEASSTSSQARTGLPTCRYLLSRYGAKMDIVTSPEDGTTYRIRVPIPEALRPAPRPEPALGPEQDLAGVYVY